MAHVSIICVVQDGSAPVNGTLRRVAATAPIQWPAGDGGTITVNVIHEDGSIYDLEGCSLALACREHAGDLQPLFAYDGTIDPTPTDPAGPPPGTASFAVLGDDTEATVAGKVYWYDVRMVASDTSTCHVLPPSKWIPTMTIAKAGEP
jgi:hypothetical protein